MASLNQRHCGYNELGDDEAASRNMSELLGAFFSRCGGVRNSFLFRSAASLLYVLQKPTNHLSLPLTTFLPIFPCQLKKLKRGSRKIRLASSIMGI